MNKTLIIVVFVLIGLLTAISLLYKNERSERIRLDKNQSALYSGINAYKTKDSLNAAKIKQINLEKSELKELESILVDSLKKQGYKIKRLESITQVKTITEVKFIPQLKDSLIYKTDTLYKIPCYEYKDRWINFIGCMGLDSIPIVKISQTDSIGIVAHRVPKFLWFGTKYIDVDLTSFNPYTKIVYAKNIVLKK